MDSDDISLPERLQQQVAFLKSHPAIDAVGVGTRMVYEDLTPRLTYRLSKGHALIVYEMLVGGAGIVRAASDGASRVFGIRGCGYDPRIRQFGYRL